MPHEDFNGSISLPTPASKPQRGARLLSILLRLFILHTVLTFFFLFAGLAVLGLILLFVAGKFLRLRRRLLFQRPSIEILRGLSREEMRRLPCFRCSQSVPDDDCVVCLQGFGEGEWCRVLPGCKHLFHRVCVDRWLQRSRVCPICRGGVAAGWI